MNIFFGFVSLLLGLFGVWHWHSDFLSFVRGFLPASLCLAGLIAIAVGDKNEKK